MSWQFDTQRHFSQSTWDEDSTKFLFLNDTGDIKMHLEWAVSPLSLMILFFQPPEEFESFLEPTHKAVVKGCWFYSLVVKLKVLKWLGRVGTSFS